MKSLSLIICFAFLPVALVAQKVYHNKIGKVTTLNIRGKNNKVTAEKIVINKTLDSKLYIIDSKIYRDSLNNYVTDINLGNNDNLPLFNVDIQIDATDRMSKVYAAPFGGGVEYGTIDSLTEDGLHFAKVAQQVIPTAKSKIKMVVRIISKMPLRYFTFRRGIAGKLED